MPYIIKPERVGIDVAADIIVDKAESFGKLNYAITKIVLGYARKYYPKSKYSAAVVVMGTLVCVGLEFYRRFVAPHEDEKIKENGDVY